MDPYVPPSQAPYIKSLTSSNLFQRNFRELDRVQFRFQNIRARPSSCASSGSDADRGERNLYQDRVGFRRFYRQHSQDHAHVSGETFVRIIILRLTSRYVSNL